MGWFDNSDESEPAISHALTIARKKSLPLTARSCTKAEYLGRYRKFAYITIGIYLLFGGGILIGPMIEGGRENEMVLAFAGPLLIAGLLLIWLVMRWRIRRNGKYQDPGLAVDVGADGIIVRGAGGDHGMRWHEIEARPIWISIKSGIHFTGLWVQSPLGWVQLSDEFYRQGLAAAALIVRGMHDDYHARQKARIERIG